MFGIFDNRNDPLKQRLIDKEDLYDPVAEIAKSLQNDMSIVRDIRSIDEISSRFQLCRRDDRFSSVCSNPLELNVYELLDWIENLDTTKVQESDLSQDLFFITEDHKKELMRERVERTYICIMESFSRSTQQLSRVLRDDRVPLGRARESWFFEMKHRLHCDNRCPSI